MKVNEQIKSKLMQTISAKTNKSKTRCQGGYITPEWRCLSDSIPKQLLGAKFSALNELSL